MRTVLSPLRVSTLWRRSSTRSSGGRDGQCYPGGSAHRRAAHPDATRRPAKHYRVAMYIVISKPKRMSSKDGLDHFIAISKVVFDNVARACWSSAGYLER